MILDSLYIHKFRIFDKFEIECLGKVNLIVGNNNSGKSCLLEALNVYARNASPALLLNLVKQRGEDWEIETRKDDDLPLQGTEHPARYLFHGYHFPDVADVPLEIGSLKNQQDRIKLHIRAYQSIETKEGRKSFSPVDEKDLPDDLEDVERVIELEQDGESRVLIRLDRDITQAAVRHYLPARHPLVDARLNVQFVPTSHIDNKRVGVLWDKINVKPGLRKEVFRGLQLIDSKIQEVVLVGRNVPILLYDNGDKLPIKSLGDGIIHLFHVILALVNARDGFLLIDEFENGLHYTAQPKIWNLVFELAESLNVQVFATTHSWDCVSGFQEAAQQHSAEAMLIHLGRSVLEGDRGRIIATVYNNEELQLATKTGLELRG